MSSASRSSRRWATRRTSCARTAATITTTCWPRVGIGADAPPPTRGQQVGLYHLAWEVETLPDLARAQTELANAGALTGASDHGNSLSLYARDPDANEFEVFWMVPRDEWATRGFGTRALDLDGELRRRGLV